MKYLNFKICINLLVFLATGCATLSNRDKILITMAGSAAGGAIVGYVTTPAGTSPSGHTALWASVAAASAGVISLFVFDEKKRSDELERQNIAIKKELSACPKRKLLGEYNDYPGKPIPEHLKPFLKPEKIKEYSIDLWIDKTDSDENVSQYHCDKEVEYEPGSFRRPGKLKFGPTEFKLDPIHNN